jgi:hypothetical protein
MWIGLAILVVGILVRLLTALHPFIAVGCVVAGYILWFTSPPIAAVWRRPDTPRKMVGVFVLTVLSIGVLAAILVWTLR